MLNLYFAGFIEEVAKEIVGEESYDEVEEFVRRLTKRVKEAISRDAGNRRLYRWTHEVRDALTEDVQRTDENDDDDFKRKKELAAVSITSIRNTITHWNGSKFCNVDSLSCILSLFRVFDER